MSFAEWSSSSGRPPLDRVDHVAIAVRDASKAQKYFSGTLGLTVVGDEIAEVPGVRLVYLDAGNTFIQLVEPVREGSISRWLADHGEGLHHLCFATTRIEDLLATLPDEESAPIFPGGRGRRACFLLGEAHNVKIEITEHGAML